MRTLTSTLQAAQQSASINPLIKIVLTSGETSYTYEKDRILDINHPEEPYSQKADLVLDNSDGTLTDLALQGFQGVISYGAITPSGEEYVACAPLWVIAPTFSSAPGKLTCSLSLIGIPNLMAQDQASAAYQPASDDTNAAKTLIDAIAGATLTCFNHCTAYETEWEVGYNDLADTYYPKDSFRIYTGGSRLSALRRLLEDTGNVMRVENDGKIHIFAPTTEGTTYDYEYSLESGHTFFSKAYRKRLVIPNYIVVKSQTNDDPQIDPGIAIDTNSNDLIDKRAYYQMRLADHAQADAIAAALLLQEQLWSEAGSADVPLNIGAEIWDYVKVTDERESDYRIGNLGHLTRHWNAAKREWRMTFSFGNWMTTKKALANLGEGTISSDDLEAYFTRLRVKDAYVEHLLIDQLDIVMDDIPDGSVYGKIKSVHLDAGGLVINEYASYAVGYDPSGKRRTFLTTPTTPYDLGDLWFDASTVKRCTTARATGAYVAGDWTATTIDAISDGTTYKRVQSAALSAAGLVLLDQVVVGTYGLVASTDISAGHILLSTALAVGDWYDESGVEISATTGIQIYGGVGVMGLTTRATKDGTIQCYVGTDGLFYAGGGNVVLSAAGLQIYGQYLAFYYGAFQVGTIYGYDASTLAISGATRFASAANFLAALTVAGKLKVGSTGSFVLPRRSSAPTSPEEGEMYLDSDDNNIYAYINADWQTLHNY